MKEYCGIKKLAGYRETVLRAFQKVSLFMMIKLKNVHWIKFAKQKNMKQTVCKSPIISPHIVTIILNIFGPFPSKDLSEKQLLNDPSSCHLFYDLCIQAITKIARCRSSINVMKPHMESFDLQ